MEKVELAIKLQDLCKNIPCHLLLMMILDLALEQTADGVHAGQR